MAGLGEEVEGLNVFDVVSCLFEFLEVSHLGGWLTGDVNAASGGELEELV